MFPSQRVTALAKQNLYLTTILQVFLSNVLGDIQSPCDIVPHRLGLYLAQYSAIELEAVASINCLKLMGVRYPISVVGDAVNNLWKLKLMLQACTEGVPEPARDCGR